VPVWRVGLLVGVKTAFLALAEFGVWTPRVVARQVRAHGRRGPDEPLRERAIATVVRGLLGVRDPVVNGDRRPTRAGELRKHVPDPVAGFPSRLELRERPRETDAGPALRFAEAGEVRHHGGDSSRSGRDT